MSRSVAAVISEIVGRLSGFKKKLKTVENFEKLMKVRTKEQLVPYKIPEKFKKMVETEQVDSMTVYYLNRQEKAKKRILYIHGGAYIYEMYSQHWDMLNKIAKDSGAEIIIPIYQLAPTHNFKDNIEILIKIYKSLLNDNSEIILMGDSAGGGLALGLSYELADRNYTKPDKTILLSPWLDVTMENLDYKNYESKDPLLAGFGLKEAGKLWAGELSTKDERISPLYGDYKKLQNITLFVGTREIFYPDVTTFYNNLVKQGVKAQLYVGEEMNHVWPLFPIPETKETLKQINKIINN